MTGFMGYNVKEHKATIWDDGNRKFSTTPRTIVADAVARVLKNPEAAANKYLRRP
ncbi:hypothetical protein B0H11DRAFT_1966356 [Mycena galericulata]|nr:hypothetical protein B0H11DRAFT_1966356 [Mycena galericulata]